MVAIGDKPIIWHIMQSFKLQGFDDFVIALGYKGDKIKRWLIDLADLHGNILIDFNSNSLEREVNTLGWRVAAVETGLDSGTAQRIYQCMKIFHEEMYLVTYGDGLANINLDKLVEFHKNHGKKVTVTAVRPPARFGNLEISEELRVTQFGEKKQSQSGWINGGYFVINSEVISYLENGVDSFEFDVLPKIAADGELMAYLHDGFWKPMDTLREKNELTELVKSGLQPWLEQRGF